MAFTSQIGGPDSQLGNIQIGGASVPVVVPDWFPSPRDASTAIDPAQPLPVRRLIPPAFLATLNPVSTSWMPRRIAQKVDANMPGEIIAPVHHMRRMTPPAYTVTLPTIPPASQIINVPMVRRNPSAPRVLGGFTDLVSSVFNSLTHSGQLVQAGPGAYRIVVAPGMVEFLPQAQPDVSPYYGKLWVDSSGQLHYLPPNGSDIQLTPVPIDFLTGHGAPSEAVGELGYHYLDLDTGDLYKKLL